MAQQPPVGQQEQAAASAAQDWQGQNGANSAWWQIQTHVNLALPMAIDQLRQSQSAMGRLG